MALPAAILAPALKYGIPAGIELVKLGLSFIEDMKNDPSMTQEQFNQKWSEMQAKVRTATDAHQALHDQGR